MSDHRLAGAEPDDRLRAIDRIFCQALDLDEGARGAFLDEACAGDSAMRAEVDSLLTSATTEDGLLRPGGAASPELLREIDTELAEVAAGARIGRYRILGLLGRGGMGVVHLAERADGAYRQKVALKRLRVGAGPAAIERFTRERQILASLEHPGIARLLDGGVDRGGEPYLVVEHVEGLPLTDYCAERELPLGRRLELLVEICRAVSAAHRQLVVHRDLKPSNILVTPEGRVKLLDFGIAKLLEGTGVDVTIDSLAASELPTVGAMTPQYASPEQFQGRRVTVASDLYQLGLLAYELLSGEPPYAVRLGSLKEAEELICHRDPPPPSSRVEATAKPVAPRRKLEGDLDAIVLQALRKEPESRYRSVDHLREDLERHLAGLPVAARPATLGYRLGKLLRRHAAVSVAAAAALVTVVAVTATFTWRLAEERDRTREQAHQATLERDHAERRRLEAEQVSGYLVDLFRVLDPYVLGDTKVTPREILDLGVPQLDQRLAGTPLIRARLQKVIGRLYDQLGESERAEELLTEALAVQEAAGDEQGVAAAETMEQLGLFRVRHDRREEALELLERALEIKLRLLGAGHLRMATTHNALGTYFHDSGRTEEAEREISRAVEIYRDHLGERARLTVLHRGNLAAAWYRQGRLREAKAEMEAVLAIADAEGYTADARFSSVLSSLAVLTAQLGDPAEAVGLFERAVLQFESAYGSEHPGLIAKLNNLGTCYTSLGRSDEARRVLERALELARKIYGPDHSWVGNVLSSLVSVELKRERFEAARRLSEEALAVQEVALPPTHPYVGLTANGYGEALAGLERLDEARGQFERSLGIFEASLGSEHPYLAIPQLNLARLHQRRGEPELAEPLFRRAVALRQGLDPSSEDREEAEDAYAAFLRDQGRGEEVERLLRDLSPSP